MVLTEEQITHESIVDNILYIQLNENRITPKQHTDTIVDVSEKLEKLLYNNEEILLVNYVQNIPHQVVVNIISCAFLLYTCAFFPMIDVYAPKYENVNWYETFGFIVKEFIGNAKLRNYLDQLNGLVDLNRINELEVPTLNDLLEIIFSALTKLYGTNLTRSDLQELSTLSITIFANFYFNNVFSFPVKWRPVNSQYIEEGDPRPRDIIYYIPSSVLSNETKKTIIDKSVLALTNQAGGEQSFDAGRVVSSPEPPSPDSDRAKTFKKNVNPEEKRRQREKNVDKTRKISRQNRVQALRGMGQPQQPQSIEVAIGGGRKKTKKGKKIRRSIRKNKKQAKYKSKKN